MKPIISPSILSADFAYLAKDLEMINRSEADWVHIDIMDGVFVPNISFGFPVLKYVAKLTQKPLDVHLMIVNPEKFIPEVKALGAHIMNVHYEACPHLHRVVQQIREAGMQPAVTINPATPVDGGVNLETGARLVAAGADALVAGNAIFAAENPEETIHAMKGL